MSVVVPEGWKLVPVVPTSRMLVSGHNAGAALAGVSLYDRLEVSFQAMLAAAPPPPANIGADSPSARDKALDAARSRIQAIYDSPNNSRSPDYWAGLADALFEVETLISSALESSK